MSVQINLTIKQIYDVCCPECRQKLIDLAARQGSIQAVKNSLKQQLEAKDKD